MKAKAKLKRLKTKVLKLLKPLKAAVCSNKLPLLNTCLLVYVLCRVEAVAALLRTGLSLVVMLQVQIGSIVSESSELAQTTIKLLLAFIRDHSA